MSRAQQHARLAEIEDQLMQARQELRAENLRLRARLAALGLPGMKMGLEAEIEMPRKSPRRLAVRPARGGLLAREILVARMLADPRHKEALVPLDGPHDYYDNPDVLEIKTQPFDQAAFADKAEQLRQDMGRKACRLGLDPGDLEGANLHLNVSFEDAAGHNIFASRGLAPEDKARQAVLMQRTTTGINYALRDAFPFLESPRINQALLDAEEDGCRVSGVHPGRERYARLAEGRLELRVGRRWGDVSLEAFSMVVMAGAAYGLCPGDEDFFQKNVPQTRVVRAPDVRLLDPAFAVLAHLLTGSIVQEDGFLAPPENYASDPVIVETVVEELGLSWKDAASPFLPDLAKYRLQERFSLEQKLGQTPWLASFLSGVRVETQANGKSGLVWPCVLKVGDFALRFHPFPLDKAFELTGLRQAVEGSFLACEKDAVREEQAFQQNKAFLENLSAPMLKNLALSPRMGLSAYLPPMRTLMRRALRNPFVAGF